MFAIEPAAGIFSLFGAGFSEREFALTSGTRIFSVVRFRRGWRQETISVGRRSAAAELAARRKQRRLHPIAE